MEKIWQRNCETYLTTKELINETVFVYNGPVDTVTLFVHPLHQWCNIMLMIQIQMLHFHSSTDSGIDSNENVCSTYPVFIYLADSESDIGDPNEKNLSCYMF